MSAGIVIYDVYGNVVLNMQDSVLKLLGRVSASMPHRGYAGDTVDVPLSGVTPSSVVIERTGYVGFGLVSVTPHNGYIRCVALVDNLMDANLLVEAFGI